MKVLTKVQSKSNPGTQYEIRLSGGGQVYCTCPAWRYGKPVVTYMNGQREELKKPCKHLKELGYTQFHKMEVPSAVFAKRN